MNLAQSEEFKDVPGLQSLVQKALERVQEAFLAKSLEKSAVKVPEIQHKVLEEIAVVSPAVEETPVVTK